MTRTFTFLALAGALAAPASTATAAVAPQPPIDRAALKATYNPVGFFKPGDAIPMPAAPPPPTAGGIYNPSGHWSAYDSNVYESLNFPGRQAGDETNNDPPGSGFPIFGKCPPNPQYEPAGRCLNHALEYLDYYEATMKEILKDFGGVVQRYEFVNPGRSDTGGAVGQPGGLSSPGGKTFNIAGIVPGADNPDEEVIVSGHWDFTDAAHAAAWDSSEGHAEVIRMAKIMTDYWRATGTRPSATVKFMPWAAEESGTFGSLDYVQNYILEDDVARVRAYFNVDPCAGAYPAFYHGNPAQQIPMVLHLSDPSSAQDPERLTAFNAKAEKVIDEFWEDIDDTVQIAGGVTMPVYTDADRGQIVTALGGLLVFGSDYSNFAAVGVPIFNIFPDMFGPHADGTPANGEGAATIHTPRDHLATLNQLTSGDQTGLTASDGWMKGMELCAQLEARYMLQPEMGGAQTANLDPVAYFEPFKPKALKGKLVTFDGSGSYQYGQLATRGYVDESKLQWRWDFGDGSPPAFGKVVKHAYNTSKLYTATLTLTNRETSQADTAKRMVLVEDSDGTDTDPPGQDQDPGLRPPGSVIACQSGGGFTKTSVKPAGAGLAFSASSQSGQSYNASVWQASVGRRAIRPKQVAKFTVNGSYKWNGKPSKGKLPSGVYYAKLDIKGTGARPDIRSAAFERARSKFKARKPFQRADSCGAVSLFRLDSPAFGGSRKLKIAFTTTKDARVTINVYRGTSKKPVAKTTKRTKANRLAQFILSPKRLKRGEYRIVLSAGGKKETLYARKL